jgi:two-component system OmpR family sensor kinase/two-component system sensor histidine kinase BaeS
VKKLQVLNRLWVRLALAFAVVAVIGVGLLALLAGLSIDREFRSFVARNAVDLQNSSLADDLVEYYTQHQSWAGVSAVLTQVVSTAPGFQSGGPPPNFQPGGPPPDPSRGRVALLVADVDGRIVFDSRQQRMNDVLNPPERQSATALQANDQTIGYMVISPGPIGNLRPIEQTFVDQVRENLVLAGLIASLVGMVLGVAFSRTLTRPLHRLVAAARAIAARDLTHRVEPAGTIEVANVAHAFNDMADSLQRAEELRRNLVADVAHELRTPLSVMQGNLAAQLDGVFPLDLAETARLYDETRLLSRLVDDLRELAQVEAGQLHLEIGAIDVRQLIESTAAVFQPMADDKTLSLTLNVPADLPRVTADGERVAQVLRVFLSNALRHTTANGAITIGAQAVAAGVEVSVRDTGDGIAPDDVPYVFDRFWRGDKSRARETGGSGLGLAIARQLIEAQGGTIGVETQVGQGSRFWFRLPVTN